MSHRNPDRICPHKLPLDDCPWCAPARVVQEAPPNVLEDLGGEQVGGDKAHPHG
jgi:hypothetical protein